jgi:hypothetical protein
MPFHHQEIMKIAEGLYDNLLKVVVNDTIYPPRATQIKDIESAYVRR